MTDPITEYRKTMDDETVRIDVWTAARRPKEIEYWEDAPVEVGKALPTPIDSLLIICLLLAGMFCGVCVVLTIQAVFH